MSQRRSGNRTQNNQSQSPKETVDTQEVANEVVRYLICRTGDHLIISKAELNRNVIHKSGGNYNKIIEKAQDILRNVYGYNLILCDKGNSKEKYYILSTILPYIKDSSETEENLDDIHRVLILLVLSHIFMSNNNVSDTSLYAFLNNCGIDVTLKHPLFGQVKDYINKVMVKEQYLIVEIDSITKKSIFKWGMRAEKEISKMAVLNFVCEMYKNKQPEKWVEQHKAAKEQPYENYVLGSSEQKG
ncbi:melanoma-associated antigen D2 [Euwallacea similis]|uniref:melanoma-associated antigen D2 n=1 Tax=Euwallacea similis TaxID=1736056 RepID=UPI00344CEFD8